MPRLTKRQSAGRRNQKSENERSDTPKETSEELLSNIQSDDDYDLEMENEAPSLLNSLNAEFKRLSTSEWRMAEKFRRRDGSSERTFFRNKKAKLERENSMKGCKTLLSYWTVALNVETSSSSVNEEETQSNCDISDEEDETLEGIECEINDLCSIESAAAQLQHLLNQKEEISDAQKLQRMAMLMYLRLLMSGMKKTAARNQIALQRNWTGHKARRITYWTNEFLISGRLPQSNRGKHIKTFTMFTDETVQLDITAFLRSNKKTASPKTLKEYLETRYFPERAGFQTPKAISEETCRVWMKRLGWENILHRKDVYVDGHERADVVEERVKFLDVMEALESCLLRVDESNYNQPIPIPPTINGEATHILVTHDETVFSAYDGEKTYWSEQGQIRLLPKGKGKGIMVSDFLTRQRKIATIK